MRKIFKYEVDGAQGDVQIKMPALAEIVHVEHQSADPAVVTFWAEVDPDDETEIRTFHVYGTGHPIKDDGVYVGTSLVRPDLVWHLYEVTE